MKELKPCPFCGCEFINFRNALFQKWYIACSRCGCRTEEMYESADYSVKEKLAEVWNERAEQEEQEEQIKTVYGYDIDQLILFAECCREAGITETDLANVEDCCKLAIEATEKAMEESFKKSCERFEIWKN